MNLTATHINLLHVCHRELWLHVNEIRMEHTSDLVYEGKHIHEHSYAQRAVSGRELEISVPFEDDELFAKIDFYDSKKKIVHEIKKSDKAETAHIWQLKFYLFV